MSRKLRADFVRLQTIIALALLVLLLAPHPAQAWTLKTLHSFCTWRGCEDGIGPRHGLIMDATGTLYGTTYGGGSGTPHTIFAITNDPDTGKRQFQLLHKFHKSRCDYPAGNLIIDTAGTLFGLAQCGGSNGAGYFYELTRNSKGKLRDFKILYQFCSLSGCADGNSPFGNLTYAGAENGVPYDGVSPLFGVTANGGAQNDGTAFVLNPVGDTWHESVLYNFCSKGGSSCTDGRIPARGAGLIKDANGNLFGRTAGGGANGYGLIFELANSGGTWSEIPLYNLCSPKKCSDGYSGSGNLLFGISGKLLGTMQSGGKGKECCGVIFSLDPDGAQSNYSVLHEFCTRKACRDGATPTAGLISDAAGNLFGTTSDGGSHYFAGVGGGTVFELSGASLTTLYDFCSKSECHDGANPAGPLIMDTSGHLFGTTVNGGEAEAGGTVFELSP